MVYGTEGFQTDKYQHGLVPIYEQVLERLKGKDCRLLEVGTHLGGSLQFFADLLPNGQIIGVDIIPPTLRLPVNVVFYQADQNNPESFSKAISHGPFDAVIDDGAHMINETKTTFETLWSHVKSGGVYVIEDWGVGYFAEPKYQGMKEFVLEIISKKEGISAFRIECSDNHSICILWKA